MSTRRTNTRRRVYRYRGCNCRREADADIGEFIRRMVFNTLIGNADMHIKNWSVYYPDKRTARLAPAYDFVSTIPYIADSGAALTVSRTKRLTALMKQS
ncbi:MAG: HipA domain-containing protein [Halioglobus sp.]